MLKQPSRSQKGFLEYAKTYMHMPNKDIHEPSRISNSGKVRDNLTELLSSEQTQQTRVIHTTARKPDHCTTLHPTPTPAKPRLLMRITDHCAIWGHPTNMDK